MEEDMTARIPLIGAMAPAFHAVTTRGEIDFPGDYLGKWCVLFSYPADYTPVSTTEFMSFASMMNEFKERNTELVGLSIDSIYSHIAWLRKIHELSWKDIKHVEVTFPVIADISMKIAKKYGMLHTAGSESQVVRAVFVIDPEGRIRAILHYPVSMGRSIPEIMRLVRSLQEADAEHIVTPANWMPGEDVILPPPSTSVQADERLMKAGDNMYSLDWFMCFRQSDGTCKDYPAEPEFIPYPSAYPTRRRMNLRRKM